MTRRESSTRILIADDQTIFRAGLRTLLSSQPELEVVGEASDGFEALELVKNLKPDILLLDLLMPKKGGIEVLEELSEAKNGVRVIVLSAEAEGKDVPKAFELGARGLVLKDSASSTLFECVQAVVAGQYWIGRNGFSSLSHILSQCSESAKSEKPKNFGLTPRELDIIRAVVSGYSNKEIARKFKISEQTVKHHITNIFDKLGVFNRLELTLFAFHHGIIKE